MSGSGRRDTVGVKREPPHGPEIPRLRRDVRTHLHGAFRGDEKLSVSSLPGAAVAAGRNGQHRGLGDGHVEAVGMASARFDDLLDRSSEQARGVRDATGGEVLADGSRACAGLQIDFDDIEAELPKETGVSAAILAEAKTGAYRHRDRPELAERLGCPDEWMR